MEVILLKDVEKVGLRGEVVTVARGYARNFLLPRKLAQEATAARVSELQKRDAVRARHEAASFEEGQQIAETLGKTVLRFEVKAGPNGVLFGSVTPTDIADEIWRTRKVRVDRRKIGVDNLKRIGRYEVPVEVFQDVTVEIKTLVVPEGGELPSDEELAAMEAAELAAAAPPESATAAETEADAEAEAEADELEPTPEERAQELPDDDFDRAVNTALEQNEL